MSKTTRVPGWFDYHPSLTSDVRDVRTPQQPLRRPLKAGMTTHIITSFESPDSSSIAGASYNPTTHQLTVTFKRSKSTQTYLYHDVPQALWERFAAAESKGQFFTEEIRPIYAGQRVAA